MKKLSCSSSSLNFEVYLLFHLLDISTSGTYPALPPVESIDFSTLKEEAEWKLLFSHLLAFPDVLMDTVKDGFTTQDLSVKFETQKVFRCLLHHIC